MKKRMAVWYAFACLLMSCERHDGKTSITYKDKDDTYSMKAFFNSNRNKAVEYFMNEKIGNKNNLSFINTEMDAEMRLNDGTSFYLLKKPGHIEIKLDKAKNSPQAYFSVKSMCEEMKEVLTQ
jgi:hypothetical protein